MTMTTSPVLSWALPLALAMLALAIVFALVRILKGPSAQDRVLALDCMYQSGMLAMLVLGIYYGSTHYFEAALLIALLGFASSTAMAKFLLRGEVIE
ncbi:K+/H+ antiporter subunit F [Paracidovorax avenae]|uniref:Multiple resistance and pH regulation protein F n=1 Tax=Paracidovorax avenae (strain ATCC 19860 / DSM 7227 / CCUG 15838 / JCM 20985 / LMG 2117 / NCPPB 1011) TaxID=643561 RepID=F0Q878_PARA1|nr:MULTISPECIES: K+/H+ antiporter subunit F [Comamonadaceae]ADX45876.1 multiple resistance and pH regulation protein F [Paracidovorax avenae ATCC 19860]AVS61854.1 K+/H+ antiporter subunit F [Paracidovorax avenae]AVS70391.1 K+/H+ antiporter subunit F [Paracidovorax avenae]AVS77703.1 K+/H+ antiporter subunit F [Paracidovorax avenae]AVS80972.1 K+/H+ antiporter subunit F [Paracidovorax avenae]